MAMSNALNDMEREIEDLLPFYHNGRLAAADRLRVEAAIRSNAELRRRLELIAEEADAAIALNEALRAPSPRGLEALMAKIEAEPKRAAQRVEAVRQGMAERFGRFLAALSPRTLAYATAAGVAIIAFQGVVLTGVMPGGGSGSSSYQTASAPALGEGTFVLVSFVPEAKAGAIADLLKGVGASIVEGPRASGLYRVRIGDKTLPKDEAERILARLRTARDAIAVVAPDR
jgi:anti-sigma factor RsiW